MSTVFTKIIEGEFPGTFVWRDERCVTFGNTSFSMLVCVVK